MKKAQVSMIRLGIILVALIPILFLWGLPMLNGIGRTNEALQTYQGVAALITFNPGLVVLIVFIMFVILWGK